LCTEYDWGLADQNQTLVACVGIVCVTAIEAVALYRGIDGTYLSVVVGAICTIIGLMFGVKITASKAENGVAKG